MFVNQKLDVWSNSYWERVTRNIGPIMFEEQEIIRTSRVAVLGVGGLGGPLAENWCSSVHSTVCRIDPARPKHQKKVADNFKAPDTPDPRRQVQREGSKHNFR